MLLEGIKTPLQAPWKGIDSMMLVLIIVECVVRWEGPSDAYFHKGSDSSQIPFLSVLKAYSLSLP